MLRRAALRNCSTSLSTSLPAQIKAKETKLKLFQQQHNTLYEFTTCYHSLSAALQALSSTLSLMCHWLIIFSHNKQINWLCCSSPAATFVWQPVLCQRLCHNIKCETVVVTKESVTVRFTQKTQKHILFYFILKPWYKMKHGTIIELPSVFVD